MNEFKELFSKLKIDSTGTNLHYVYYDQETKKIHKISPKKEDSKFECFSITTEEVEPILTGQVRTEDYYVYFDYGFKKYSIQRKFNENFSNISLVEVSSYEQGDLSIVVDDTYITFEAAEELTQHLKNDETVLNFIVTERSNPYVLYYKCDILARNLVHDNRVEHHLSRKQLEKGLSIYTNPVFSTYSLKVNYD